MSNAMSANIAACRTLLAIAVTALFPLSGCLARNGASTLAALDSHPYSFDHKTVAELLLTKSDPSTGDSWSARLVRGPDLPDGQVRWKIASAPGGRPLLDDLADERFVMHCLDSLRSLKIVAHAPESAKPTDAVIGLARPTFALRWNEAGGIPHTLELGSPSPDGGGWFALLADGASAVEIVSGSVPALLAHLDSFEALRRTRWSTVPADDIDEIEVRVRTKTRFYAQRDGDHWSDREHRKLPSNVQELLSGLMTAEVSRFLDDSSEAESARAQIGHSAREIVVKDRHGVATVFGFSIRSDRTTSTLSTRPGAVVELRPESRPLLARFFDL